MNRALIDNWNDAVFEHEGAAVAGVVDEHVDSAESFDRRDVILFPQPSAENPPLRAGLVDYLRRL